MFLPRSSVRGIEWPALADARTARQLALLWQLEQSEWWSADELQAHQERQLAGLLAHVATVPHYEATLAGATVDEWARIPILTRQALIGAGPRLLSRAYPAQHGDAPETVSSRSTGEPVRVRMTEVVGLFWEAITLRDHAWHRRDLSQRLGAIRYLGPTAHDPRGAQATGWGPATAGLAPDAPLSLLSIATTTEQQVAWLLREDPAYLLVYPSVLGAMLRQLATGPDRPRALRQVRTVSEALSPDTRALCRDVLGVPLVDAYSAQEVGYLALQCPDHGGYHVQSERVRVEILDDDGAPCRPGEVGRVIVTDLHNFATPLVRYEIGDYAEVGAPCPCGRGLPTLARIVGRRRGILRYPDGRTAWPLFAVACREAAPYRELQLVQDALDALRLRVVAPVPLTPAQRDALTRALQTSLDHPFAVTIEEVPELDRSPAGKLDEFICRLP